MERAGHKCLGQRHARGAQYAGGRTGAGAGRTAGFSKSMTRRNGMIRKWVGCLVLGSILPLAAYAGEAGSTLADAARVRDIDTVRALLKPGLSKEEINTPGFDGTPALHWVVRIDDVETAKLLVNAGADVTLATRYGVTPLFLAASNGNTDMIRMLLDAGADPNAVDATGEP